MKDYFLLDIEDEMKQYVKPTLDEIIKVKNALIKEGTDSEKIHIYSVTYKEVKETKSPG